MKDERTPNHRTKGVLMAIGASALWGLSGNVAQALFDNYQAQAPWLVNVRLIGAGLLCLLLSVATKGPRGTAAVLRHRTDGPSLLVYAVFGMVGVQYTFFSCIQAGNAPTATLLQYACPLFLVAWFAIRRFKPPTPTETAACLLAIPGITLLKTNGSTESLAVSGTAVAWGLLSAVAAAFYIAYPTRLIERWGAPAVTGWGMLIGGLCMLPFVRPWETGNLVVSPVSLMAIAFVVVFGTFLAFVLYLDSTRHISPTEASLLGSAEPLSAAAVSILWLHETLGGWQMAGSLLVMGTVALLSLSSGNGREPEPATADK